MTQEKPIELGKNSPEWESPTRSPISNFPTTRKNNNGETKPVNNSAVNQPNQHGTR